MYKSFDKEVEIGLYRHFKGGYYFLSKFMKYDGEDYCCYFNVCKPFLGEFLLKVSDWYNPKYKNERDIEKSVKESLLNRTGQSTLFAKVDDLSFELGSVETSLLVYELDKRKDSPFKDLDIDRLNSFVVDRTYVCANVVCDELRNIVAFNTLDEAKEYRNKHDMINKPVKVFKRVYIEEEV